MEAEEVPTCECGGIIKPDVVLYEEGLDDEVVSKAIYAIAEADILIIGGTSLSVYPASGLIRYYSKDKMVLINKSVTPYDREADLLINAGLGEIFSKL
jgi:NAD-dependent deacetylase